MIRIACLVATGSGSGRRSLRARTGRLSAGRARRTTSALAGSGCAASASIGAHAPMLARCLLKRRSAKPATPGCQGDGRVARGVAACGWQRALHKPQSPFARDTNKSTDNHDESERRVAVAEAKTPSPGKAGALKPPRLDAKRGGFGASVDCREPSGETSEEGVFTAYEKKFRLPP